MAVCFLRSKLVRKQVGCMEFVEIGLRAVNLHELLMACIEFCIEGA